MDGAEGPATIWDRGGGGQGALGVCRRQQEYAMHLLTVKEWRTLYKDR